MSISYAIIGTGAIGGYYGGRLANAGKEVHFLFHTDYDYVTTHGLRVDSSNGDFYLPKVNAYNDTKDMPKCDVVFVCMKTVNNHILKDILPPILHRGTLIIPIQNGIGVEEDLEKMIPGNDIAGGMAFICSGKIGPGHINHQCYGGLTIAPYNFSDMSVVDKVISDCQDAGIDAKSAPYRLSRWKKSVWNIPFNGLTVVLNATTDKLLNDSTGELVRALMMEVINAANAIGTEEPLPVSFADEMINMTKVMTPYSPSMKLDYDFHRAMEIEYIYSRPVAEAKKHGAYMPMVSMLEKELRFLDSINMLDK